MRWQIWCAIVAAGMFVAISAAIGQEEGSSGGGGGFGVVGGGASGGGSFGGGAGGFGGSGRYVAVQGQARAEAERAHAEATRALQSLQHIIGRPAKMEKAPYLGISASPATAALREQLKLAKGMGLVVDVVEPGSPADKAGLKQYDVLQKLDDQLLVNSEQLVVLIRTFKPGDEVKLTVIRQGESRSISAKLVEKELPALSDATTGEYTRWLNLSASPGTNLVNVNLDRGGAVIDWKDPLHELKLTSDDGKARHLIVLDKSGTHIFDGPIDTPEQRKALPEGILPKVIRMENSLKAAPAKVWQAVPPTTRSVKVKVEDGGTY